eukprot:CAMPEP_0181228154 /NCGR_PEP_ID=MMETSP1096-20121128/33196_1 /TAXON_ID=156174 ORGANISM="Chrysochromulina ericina, Strain CCMP281" /NCGR_SAMPLE_ID=MMETSP1096 /ASSEMBLY_ACC=CAM_ASM_000453 /LENGTH=76 /DNA_ID=CAMNT_0023321659 /DNA_START=546 /DNA_END=776 /DNA_ORIENTATION=+
MTVAVGRPGLPTTLTRMPLLTQDGTVVVVLLPGTVCAHDAATEPPATSPRRRTDPSSDSEGRDFRSADSEDPMNEP